MGIFGNSILATPSNAIMGVPSSFWVDELLIMNIPVDTTVGGTGQYSFLPIGALYTTVPPGSGFKASPIYIK